MEQEVNSGSLTIRLIVIRFSNLFKYRRYEMRIFLNYLKKKILLFVIFYYFSTDRNNVFAFETKIFAYKK